MCSLHSSDFSRLPSLAYRIWLYPQPCRSYHKASSGFCWSIIFIVVFQPLSHVQLFGNPIDLQHASLPSPSPSPRVFSNSCPLSQWCHPTISSSVIPFSSCLQSFPESGSFPMSQLFTSGGQSIGASVSASILPMYIQGWFPLGLTGLMPS